MYTDVAVNKHVYRLSFKYIAKQTIVSMSTCICLSEYMCTFPLTVMHI